MSYVTAVTSHLVARAFQYEFTHSLRRRTKKTLAVFTAYIIENARNNLKIMKQKPFSELKYLN